MRYGEMRLSVVPCVGLVGSSTVNNREPAPPVVKSFRHDRNKGSKVKVRTSPTNFFKSRNGPQLNIPTVVV